MATFADIKKAAEGNISTFIDDSTPAGHFGAVTKVLGLTRTYLLEGQNSVEDAAVKGCVVIEDRNGKLSATGYRGNGLVGGYFLGPVQSYEETFAQMV